MNYQETIDQLRHFAPVSAFGHHLPNPDPESIAKDILGSWEECRAYHKEDWSDLDEGALMEYAERLAEELQEFSEE